MTIKVLELPSWFQWAEELMEYGPYEAMREYCGDQHREIAPVFNRDGYYHDTVKKICWVEFAGKAFELIAGQEMHAYETALLNHKPLHKSVAKAIKTLIQNKICTKKLKELYWLDTCWHSTRRVYRSACMDRKRLIGR